MPDAIFEHPRLVAVYDALEADRDDLDAYVAFADENGAQHVVDLGCGTGTFALALAGRGHRVTGVDPAAGSLAVARAKPGAERVTWIHGDAGSLPAMAADLATMTGNVAQAIHDAASWDAALRDLHTALRPGGRLVFETRDPADRAWLRWNRETTHRTVEMDGAGVVRTWVDLIDVSLPLVTFRSHWIFAADGAHLTSLSTLRFRGRAEVEDALHRHGFAVEDVCDAPDRPGRELVFVARRSHSGPRTRSVATRA